jgi:serine protease DegQ
VINTVQLLTAVAELKPQTTATLAVQRGDRALELKVVVAQRPRSGPPRER